MKLSLIWAMAENRVIGRSGGLPWHLPREMKHFMTTTRGHPVVMGRRTFESMDRRPLPRRDNIVVTRQPGYAAPGAIVVTDLEAALTEAERCCRQRGVEEAFVIGGAELYRLALDRADRLIVTEVATVAEGDTFFPEIDWNAWRQVSCEHHAADEANPLPYTISVFERT